MEFLVAALVLGLAAAAMGSTFRAGLRLWNRSEQEMKLQQEARVVLDQIGREFRHAIDVPGVPWSVKSDEVTFPTVGESDRIKKVSYRLDEMALRVLVRREEDLAPSSGRKFQETVLTSHPTRMEWEYAYASNAAQSPVRWEKERDGSDPLPSGIRIHLALVDPEGRPQTFVRTLFSPTQDLKPCRVRF